MFKVRATTAAQRERWMRDPETILADVAAAMTPRRSVHDPMPMHVRRAMEAGRLEAQRQKRKAALKRVLDRQTAERAAKRLAAGPSVVARALAAMQPGEWHGVKAIGRAIGVPAGEVGRVMQTLRTKGWAERAPNPAWDPKPTIATFAGAVREPKWLLRLTPAGEAQRSVGARVENAEESL